MTLPFNPLRAAELARQALDDDSKMTPGEWTVSDDDQFSAIVVGSVCTFDFYEHRPDEQRDEAHAVARSRNALREMAEQLMAAVQEVERLRDDLYMANMRVDGSKAIVDAVADAARANVNTPLCQIKIDRKDGSRFYLVEAITAVKQ